MWWISMAVAATVTLDTGATLEGELTRWDGHCELHIDAGELAGTRLSFPCHRLREEPELSFVPALQLPEDPARVREVPLAPPAPEPAPDPSPPPPPRESLI